MLVFPEGRLRAQAVTPQSWFPPAECAGFTLGCGIPGPICSKTEWQISSWSFQPFCPLRRIRLRRPPAPSRPTPVLRQTQSHSAILEVGTSRRWWQVGGKPQPALGEPVGSAPCHLLPASVATREIPPSEEAKPGADKQACWGCPGCCPPPQENPLSKKPPPPPAVFLASRSSLSTCRSRDGWIRRS